MPSRLLDRRGRAVKDLRISVTDRCNFRCVLHAQGGVRRRLPLPAAPILLSFEEITRLARIFAAHGVSKIRSHRRRAAAAPQPRAPGRQLAEIPGMEVTLTTNGVLLPEGAALKAAGLASG